MLGPANDEVSRAARIFLSSEALAVALDDTRQYEFYLRYAVSPELFVTLDMQRLGNSNFDGDAAACDRHISLYRLRLTVLIESRRQNDQPAVACLSMSGVLCVVINGSAWISCSDAPARKALRLVSLTMSGCPQR